MAFRIQIRRDTSAKWEVNNTVLLEGEIGYTTDTKYMKIGDGDTTWNNLDYWNGPSTYKVYTALLTQTGTDAPTATVLENTLGNITFAYDAVGVYSIISPNNLFTLNKTWITDVIALGVGGPAYRGILFLDTPDRIGIQTEWDVDTASDSILYKVSIEIRVYN